MTICIKHDAGVSDIVKKPFPDSPACHVSILNTFGLRIPDAPPTPGPNASTESNLGTPCPIHAAAAGAPLNAAAVLVACAA